MRLTTKGRYAVTAMLDLALHSEAGPVSLSDISARQGISLSYLEQLFSKLRRKALVSSIRGPGGAMYLARCNETRRLHLLLMPLMNRLIQQNVSKKAIVSKGKNALPTIYGLI